MAVARGALTLTVFLLVWLGVVSTPWSTASVQLDSSWAQAYAELLLRPLRLGVDVVFTYGPLGTLARPVFDARLFDFLLWWAVAFQGALALVLVRARAGLVDPVARGLWLVLLVVLLPNGGEAATYVAIAAVAHGVARGGTGRFDTALGLAVVAGLALVKFSFFLCACAAIGGAAALRVRRAPGAALGAVAWTAAVFLVGWCLAGQRLGDLGAWVTTSWEVTRGYSAAMSTWGPQFVRVALFLLIGLLVGRTISFALRGPADRPRGGLALLVLGVGFVTFKAGTVTEDIHVVTTCCTLPLLMVLLEPGADRRRASFLALVLAATVASFAARVRMGEEGPGATTAELAAHWFGRIEASAITLTRPGLVKRGFATEREALRRAHALPRVRAAAAGRSVDVVDWEQGVVFLNELPWRPRPVLHSYLTYTPALVRLNREFMRSSRAPELLLYKQQGRADWLFPMKDAGWLEVVLRDYVPRFDERHYLVLERDPRPETPLVTDTDPLLRRTVGFGEEVSLVGHEEALWVALDVRLSALGLLRESLFKPPPVDLVCVTDDGGVERRRIVPGMIRGGTLLSPRLRKTDDLRHLLDEGPASPALVRTVAFRVELPEGAASSYAERIAVTTWRVPRR